jgi:hypothetical protein
MQSLQQKFDEEAAMWRAQGHQLDEDGEHYERECRTSLETEMIINSCRCAASCRRLLIEANVRDSEQEPKLNPMDTL